MSNVLQLDIYVGVEISEMKRDLYFIEFLVIESRTIFE